MEVTRIATALGTVVIAETEACYQFLAQQINALALQTGRRSVGLTGGSTPQAFYRWAVLQKAISTEARLRLFWSVSDERLVPLESTESNFGNADRLLLAPLQVPPAHKLVWPVNVDPHSAARVFNRRWNETVGAGKCFDLCLLGLGDDGHTASIFPCSPLLKVDFPEHFTCVEVPGKGWRLTVTRAGLGHCREITVLVWGEGKRAIAQKLFSAEPGTYPAQLLGQYQQRVTWLLDIAAAGDLAKTLQA